MSEANIQLREKLEDILAKFDELTDEIKKLNEEIAVNEEEKEEVKQ